MDFAPRPGTPQDQRERNRGRVPSNPQKLALRAAMAEQILLEKPRQRTRVGYRRLTDGKKFRQNETYEERASDFRKVWARTPSKERNKLRRKWTDMILRATGRVNTARRATMK